MLLSTIEGNYETLKKMNRLYIIYHKQQFLKYESISFHYLKLLVYGNGNICLFPVFVSCFL